MSAPEAPALVDDSVDELTRRLVDIESVSGNEAAIATALESTLRQCAHLSVHRDGDAVVARTELGRQRRVVLAGHLDTVPVAGNLPARRDGGRLYGCGTSDMKSGVAVMWRLATTLTDPRHDLTFVYYDNEEVESERNGLGRLAARHPHWLAADFAILMEPTSAVVEAGCQGTLRAAVTVPGRRAHTARAWLGDNAIHASAPLLAALAGYQPRRVVIDGCEYREGLSAVGVDGGVAGNVVPDSCTVTVNFRFAPDRSEQEAFGHVQEVLSPYAVRLLDTAPGALPSLGHDITQEFLGTVGGAPAAKLGWTDVARFAGLGVPSVNYGPGDPNLAHTREESVEVALIERCHDVLDHWLRCRP